MAYTLITANRNYSSWPLRPWLLTKALSIPFVEAQLAAAGIVTADFRA